jgi:hypothetical protein
MIRFARFLCSVMLVTVSTAVIADPATTPRPRKAKGITYKRSPSRLFVVDAKSGWVVKESENVWRLTLHQPQNVLWFTDRPARDSGFMKPSALQADWKKLFAGAPPNGAVVAPDGPAGKSPSAVKITEPRYNAKTSELSVLLTKLPGETENSIQWLEKLTRSRAGKNGHIVLFIDDSSWTATFTIAAPPNTTFTIDTADSNCATPYAISDAGYYIGGEGEAYTGTMYINDSGSCDFESSQAYWTIAGSGIGGTLDLDTQSGSISPFCSVATCTVDQSGYIYIQ